MNNFLNPFFQFYVQMAAKYIAYVQSGLDQDEVGAKLRSILEDAPNHLDENEIEALNEIMFLFTDIADLDIEGEDDFDIDDIYDDIEEELDSCGCAACESFGELFID